MDSSAMRTSVAESWRSYRALADTAIDVIVETDRDGWSQWVSPSVEAVLGWRPEQITGIHAAQLAHPDDLLMLAEYQSRLNAMTPFDGVPYFSSTDRVRWRTVDGGYRALSFRARPAFDDDGSVVGHVVTMQDTSERDDALRGLAVLSEGNRVLARATDEDGLMQQMCEAIVSAGQYPVAWYGQGVDDAAQSVVLRAVAGSASAYVDALQFSWGENPMGLGPGTALRTSTTMVCHDYAEETWVPWHAAALDAGLRSSIALPVTVEGQVDGVLVVEARDRRSFDEHAMGLLQTLASDLGLGLHRLRSVRELQRTAAQLAVSESRYRLLAENASDIIWQAEGDTGITWVSESVHAVLGWEPQQLLGRGADLVHPDDREGSGITSRRLDHGQVAEGRCRIAQADGGWRWMAYSAHRITSDIGFVDVVALHDIDAEVHARDALTHALGHDSLTGMAARPTMVQRVAEVLQRLDGERLAAVLCIGIDRLGSINDAYAHAAGDLVLTTVAARIAEVVDSPDLIGRGAGAEFLAIVPDLAMGDEAVTMAEQILSRAKGRIGVGADHVEPTVSIGIAIGDRNSDAEQLIRDASAAIAQAKADGRDRFAFADTSRAEQARRRLYVEARVREGLRSDRLFPHFQPVVDLSTGDLHGYEALVRYLRPDDTIAMPGRFMPVVETSPLVADVDLVMLRKSIAALRTLPESVSVAVNLSPATLVRPGYGQLIEQLIGESDVTPSRLHLEVTETALLGDTALILEAITRIADRGARWYVDDFGTGYSSISHLRDLPVAGMKLDVSFSTGIREGDEKSLRLAQALAGLASGLGLDTIAEGIESPLEAGVLREQGWQHGQGWLYGRPEPLPA